MITVAEINDIERLDHFRLAWRDLSLPRSLSVESRRLRVCGAGSRGALAVSFTASPAFFKALPDASTVC